MFRTGQKVKAEVTEFLDWWTYEEDDKDKNSIVCVMIWLMIANSMIW